MQFLDFLIALLPALFWGSVVLINVFVGGGPYNQIRGTTLGALIVGLGLLITGFAKFNNPTVIIVGLISGALWAFGQANQLKSISLIGVSNTMPVSTGMQLVGTTLFSVIFLGEWSSMTQIIFGLIAMILLVTGVALTSLKAMTSNQPDDAVFNFSFEEGIQQYKPLMKVIQASYNFTDYYIEARTRLEEDMHQPNIIPYHKGFYRAFSKLHTTTFKYQAQSPQDIIDSLDDHHHLFLFVSEGLLKGYLYLEIDSQQSIAEIKYFSSHVDYRLKGIAFELLAYALQYAFDNFDIRKVYFKIRNKNNKLIERFNGLGFHINYEYIKFKFESRNVKDQTIPE